MISDATTGRLCRGVVATRLIDRRNIASREQEEKAVFTVERK